MGWEEDLSQGPWVLCLGIQTLAFHGLWMSLSKPCPRAPTLVIRPVPTSALSIAQAYSIDVVAVVNDTVGTMMGCEPGIRPCEIGLIVGEPQTLVEEGW